jgi:inositol phosphorylceramide mannosyltransferase catalytic subunit
VRIPRILHQIWVGADPFPEDYARYQETWLDHHPSWEFRFWTEENLPDGLRRPEAAERLRAPAERANILRLELLWRFGGVYVDTDFECLRSIEPLIEDKDFFISLAKPGRVNNALMGSVAGHPILDEALDRIRPREFFGHDKEATGTRFLDALLLDRPGVTLIEPEHFYPQTPDAKRDAYAVHDMARSWKDPELLRLDVQRAERKLEQAQDQARKWRSRYEQAQTELTALNRSWPVRLQRLARRLRPKVRQAA